MTFGNFKEMDGAWVRWSLDAGRIRDRLDPAAIARHMVAADLAVYRTEAGGVVLLEGDLQDGGLKEVLWRFVSDQQSWHGDWFIWNWIQVERDGRTLTMRVP
ncbi:hypothetical protein PLESTB_001214300 [Pleodorina starrii]|uniref:Uncharacterized protein n=1 Tax=Pleodorina starrii TaxID=330485 RepID=A0A9W6F5K3_9CHLO|nr:hypothetical protein PLESTM_001644800 [Pleodorina starrii]GLC57343.1 hypothetical protein PLESTB_001214300 [Pleodorina starrii]GLC71255.1 hypothetical protein PLESTF_001095400 [Pleodorina starrii]